MYRARCSRVSSNVAAASVVPMVKSWSSSPDVGAR
jgi:hypothetical protein